MSTFCFSVFEPSGKVPGRVNVEITAGFDPVLLRPYLVIDAVNDHDAPLYSNLDDATVPVHHGAAVRHFVCVMARFGVVLSVQLERLIFDADADHRHTHMLGLAIIAEPLQTIAGFETNYKSDPTCQS